MYFAAGKIIIKGSLPALRTVYLNACLLNMATCSTSYCTLLSIPDEVKNDIKEKFYNFYTSATCAKDQQVFLMKFIISNSKGRKHYAIEERKVCKECLCKLLRIGTSRQGKNSKVGKKRTGVSQAVKDQVDAFIEHEEKITAHYELITLGRVCQRHIKKSDVLEPFSLSWFT